MFYVNKAKVPIKSWCNAPESGAIDQAVALANLPFVFKQVCLMPDTHQGYGMPIGGVVATQGVIIPNAVGVDIGCGMTAVKTSLKIDELTTEQTKKIMSLIRQTVPMGMKRHKEAQGMPIYLRNYSREELPICYDNYSVAAVSLGTLGGGNHFIEIQADEEDNVWFMLHSGSRNLGKQVCDHYNKIAIDLNTKFHNYTRDLGFLPLDSEEGRLYFAEMNYALKFAEANRNLMSDRIKLAFLDVVGDVSFEDTINIHHNYAAMENHFGKNVMVHRKGATRAREGELGIIPGSQGTASYIVVGKGNPESFMSCSHGAGRKMSRSKARNELDLETEKKFLDDQGIIHGIRGTGDLDEAASAYKDIDIVMEEQKDLVDIKYKLKPIAVLKG